ncbi:GDP-L-fucose synthase [Paludibacter sp.]
MNKESKIYVAGHLGLVGSAITNVLKNKGYKNLLLRSINELDLLNQQDVDTFFAENKPEYVILAAAKVGGIIANNIYRAQFIYENLMIQNNVIHAAYKYGVKKLLFLGSTCVYPRDAEQPMKENSLLTSPLEYTNEPYAIAKIAGLKMCESYNIQYGTNFIAVMPTNLYGFNDNFDLEKSHVLPAIIRKVHLAKCLMEDNVEALKKDFDRYPVEGVNGSSDFADILKILNKYGVKKQSDIAEVEIWGTGKPLRELLWSEDMAEACVYLMENVNFEQIKELSVNKEDKEIRNCHLNIGTGIEISIKELAEMIANIIQFKGKIVFNVEKPDGTMRKLTDPSKLHQLGWKHKINIEEGIGMLYKWYLNK